MPNPYDEDSGIARKQRHIVTMPLHQPHPTLQPALIAGQEQAAELTNKERFNRFHAENPSVYLTLRDMALDQVRSGARTVRPKQLIEWLRATGVSVDNRFSSHYARLLDLVPELSGLIPMRNLRAE